MMISIEGMAGELYYLNVQLVEAIMDGQQRSTTEIYLTTGRIMVSTWPKHKVAEKINLALQESNKTVNDYRMPNATS
jgi:uncharacterized protein YlzI (FlbEa/FlbD family)